MKMKMLIFNIIGDQMWSSTTDFDHSFICAGKCAYAVYADGVCVGRYSSTHSAARDNNLISLIGLENTIKIDEEIRQF